MAEPEFVGYKRRKNLPDLARPNQLFPEQNGAVSPEDTVLARFREGTGVSTCARLGFWTDLRHIGARSGLRLDPKYRWLWDYQHGIAIGDVATAVPLSSVLRLVELETVPKGDLDEERKLVDLESVESREAIVSEEAPMVSEIGSNKVRFEGAELVISKLEPYLAKIIINPDPEWIGTTEWVGLERLQDVPLNALTYLLMLPELCEAYRRLQSGKRHARLVPAELLDLRVSLPHGEEWQELERSVLAGRAEILSLRERTDSVRADIDKCFAGILRASAP